jgi:hypothetical protein
VRPGLRPSSADGELAAWRRQFTATPHRRQAASSRRLTSCGCRRRAYAGTRGRRTGARIALGRIAVVTAAGPAAAADSAMQQPARTQVTPGLPVNGSKARSRVPKAAPPGSRTRGELGAQWRQFTATAIAGQPQWQLTAASRAAAAAGGTRRQRWRTSAHPPKRRVVIHGTTVATTAEARLRQQFTARPTVTRHGDRAVQRVVSASVAATYQWPVASPSSQRPRCGCVRLADCRLPAPCPPPGGTRHASVAGRTAVVLRLLKSGQARARVAHVELAAWRRQFKATVCRRPTRGIG